MLFFVQGCDRECYVLSSSWATVVKDWQVATAEIQEVPEVECIPEVVTLLGSDDEVIFGTGVYGTAKRR